MEQKLEIKVVGSRQKIAPDGAKKNLIVKKKWDTQRNINRVSALQGLTNGQNSIGLKRKKVFKMQQIVINIENKKLEEKLLEEASRKGRKLATIILETLENRFLKKKNPRFRYRKLDSLKHMSKIEYEVDESDEGDLSDVLPFKDVKDSAAYVRKLRKNAWRR